MTVASRTVTRRALLGAGVLALTAGCGPPEEQEIVPAEVLGEQLAASRAAAAAHEPGPLAVAARARADQLEAALRRAGGTPGPAPRAGATGVGAALVAEHAALVAHVQAVGELEAREWRELFGELIAGVAGSEAALLAQLGRSPAPTPFPGQPAR